MFKCECGKEFTNPQSFNGHKSNCRVHLEAKGIKYEEWLLMKRNQRKLAGKTNSKNAESRKSKVISQWIAEEHKCEHCGKIMTEKFGSGRFCSRTCANSHKHSKETKQKLAEAIYKRFPKTEKHCKICGKIVSNKNKSGFCLSCWRKNYPDEVKQKQSAIMKNRPRWNIHRNQISFAEKFWTEVLSNNKINFKREVPIKYDSCHCYFLDFEIIKNDKQIDLEIDGKQHLYRAESDKKRDAFISRTHIVYRVPWNDIRSNAGKAIMKDKIDLFIKFYNEL